MYEFQWNAFWHAFPLLLVGLQTTIVLAGVVIIVSMLAAVPLSLARSSRVEVLRWPAQIYIEIFRCTPLLVQLIWIYYALPALTGITIPSFAAAALALSFNHTAFMSEAYRAGFQAVPVEHVESGRVLGLRKLDVLRFVQLPQMLRQQLPVILSLNIQLFKDTSLVSVIGIADMTYRANVAAATTYRPLEILTALALFYFAIAFPLTVLVNYLERRTGAVAPRRRLRIVPTPATQDGLSERSGGAHTSSPASSRTTSSIGEDNDGNR
jgi:polar amino acid transport system permease protein